jgi:tetratricopeptide (TPR) repeat protein
VVREHRLRATKKGKAVNEQRPGGQAPGGDVYDWFTRGLELLAAGNAAAAAAVLEHAARAEPASRSVREALARAQYDSGAYERARDNFAAIVADSPSDDYAQFGLGLASARLGELDEACEHLALAVAMAPDNRHYGTALRSARAARARE